MTSLRSFGLSLSLLAVVACTGGQPTTAPSQGTSTAVPSTAPTVAATTAVTPALTVSPTEAATVAPTVAPTTGPGASLDPSLSDAGVVGRITLSGDSRGDNRDGSHDIIGLAADGSRCAPSDLDDGFTAVAWNYGSGEGNVRQMFVVVPLDAIPVTDGSTTDLADGRAGADFNSETGFGTLYYGDATREDQGNSTIDVTRVGETLVFDFEGVTWDDVSFSGQVVCAEG